VAAVLQKLATLRQAGPTGPSFDDMDELHIRLDDSLGCVTTLEAAVAEVMEVKADKVALAKLSKAIQDVWKAVQELQGSEGASFAISLSACLFMSNSPPSSIWAWSTSTALLIWQGYVPASYPCLKFSFIFTGLLYTCR
jgi:hypothetical protein